MLPIWGIELTYCPDKNIKRSVLDICSTPKINQFDFALSIKDYVLVLDVSMYDTSFDMKMVDGIYHLTENI